MASVPHKTCLECQQVKPLSDFYRNTTSNDGYHGRCKVCHAARVSEMRRQRKARATVAIPTGYAICSACTTLLPETAFYTDQSGRRSSRCKACQITHSDALRKTKPGYRSAEAKRRRERQPDYDKQYYASERATQRREELRERRNEQERQRRQANPEKTRADRQRNKHARRARIAGNGGVFTQAEWRAMKQVQDYRCLACGRREPEITLTIDHVVPITKGGANIAANIQGLCVACNNRKRTKTIDYRK